VEGRRGEVGPVERQGRGVRQAHRFTLKPGAGAAEILAMEIGAHEVNVRWARAELLPVGTVGAALIRYYRENGWTYPGADPLRPIAAAAHDVRHVLGGYATTPTGEIRLCAFTAGAARRAMDRTELLALWEQLGGRGEVDVESCMFALGRGRSTTRDFVTADWDPWSIVGRDLESVRDQYGIGPGAQLRADDPFNRDPARSHTAVAAGVG
jgi:hypothetical protein